MLIETDRLLLKKIDLADTDVFFSYRSDPEVYKYQSWFPDSQLEAGDFIKKYSNFDDWIPGQWKQLGIYLKVNNILIGDLGIHIIDLTEVELGFTIAPAYQHKGFAKESVNAVINTIIIEKGVKRFTGITDPDNITSITLLKKLGFKQSDYLVENSEIRGELKDDVIFRLNL